jgi:hypothetical protein
MMADPAEQPVVRTRFTHVLWTLPIALALALVTAGCTHAVVLGSMAALQGLAPVAREALALGARALAEDPDEESGAATRRGCRPGTSRATRRTQCRGNEAAAASDRDGDGDGVTSDTEAGTATTRAKRNVTRSAGRDPDPDNETDPDRDDRGSASSRKTSRSAGGTRQDPFSVGKTGQRASGARGRGTGIPIRTTHDPDDPDDPDEIGAADAAAATTDAPVPRQTRSNIRPAAPGQSPAIPAEPRRARAATRQPGA